ncbi:MAG TPA: right-handed parallel beta-helix repeat-containing protein [Candidatus Binatia bacterium]|jgi:hypothetical protein|nr:right-handed parallel beta-helix repeat-containing protein [Candidatus Binatia bacterium]
MTRRLRWWSLLGLLLAAVPARAVTRSFPSTPPCSTTLQECIDGADDGDRIEIVTTAPIGGGPLQIRKGITLTGAPGVTPLLGGSATPFGILIGGKAGGPSVIRLEGLTISNGSVRVVLSTSPGGDEVTIQRCSISNTFTGSAILVDPDVPADVRLLDNFLASGGYVVDTLMAPPTGTTHLTIARNRLSASTPGYDGLQLDMRGGGQITVDVENNVIHDVASSAIVMYSLDSVAATVNVVNNTLDQTAKGVYVSSVGSTSTISLNLFNNIVSRTTGPGASFPASAQLSVTGGFNAFFGIGAANVLNGFSLGMPLYGVDPLYVDGDGADYHLKGTSTLINAGTNAPPNGLPELDYEGNLRIADSVVDVGAYEFGSVPPTTTTTTVVTSSTTTTTLACTAEATVVSIGCRLAVLTADVTGQVPAGKLRDKLLAQLATATGALQEADAATGKARKRVLRRVVKTLTVARVRLNTKAAKALDASLRSALADHLVALKRDAKTLGRSS